MRILVSGSSGFVGSNLLRYFSESGTDVEVVILTREFLDELDLVLHSKSNSEVFEVVVHLAGKADDLKNSRSPAEYYKVNTELSKKIFEAFLASEAKVFITLSSVKAITDHIEGELTEEHQPNPVTHYGKSKLLAEQYIFSKGVQEGKRVYVLRPCMIHGPGNKGNLNLLYKIVSKNIPWPFGAYDNKRSFSSIDNLLFIIKELMQREDIPSGIYNVADDEPLSSSELIELIANLKNLNPRIWIISKKIIGGLAFIGDKLQLPLNTERLHKLTSSYVVSNAKLKAAIGKPLPVSSREGLLKTFQSFNSK